MQMKSRWGGPSRRAVGCSMGLYKPEGEAMAAEESAAPRHGKHAAARKHAAPRAVEPEVSLEETGAIAAEPAQTTPAAVPEPVAAATAPAAETTYDVEPAAIPNLVSIVDGDQETRMGDAPRPIDVDPQETGSFQRIDAAEGARLTTRVNASDTASFVAQKARPIEAVRMSTAGRPKVEHRDIEVESNKRVFLVLGIAALVVVVIVGWLLSRALSSVEEVTEHPVDEQVQTAVEEGIEYRGATYTVTEISKGKYALVSTPEGSEEQTVIYELEGTPVTLVLYNMVFIVPQNLNDNTWNLIAHPLGDGSVTQPVTDSEGKPLVGEGEISEAKLVGDTIQVTTTTGESYEVSLV